ncbi:nickel-binding protein [Christiangramia sp.]|uniref:nickel-binding protein n=1 Tax=Christiangramia sp. TaxID=1931228 RepID=UPI00261400FD|nr:nickel-binding protein [Christiangramia sp.]
MPVFMDYHFLPGLTIEDVKKAHLADKQLQEKYQVEFLQLWVNKEAGTIFSLIDAPNKQACSDIHQEAHGAIACNVIDVDPGLVYFLMGDDKYLQHGIVHTSRGDIDTGYRYILCIDITSKTDTDIPIFSRRLTETITAQGIATSIISENNGKKLENIGEEGIIAVFEKADEVMECALELHEVFASKVDAAEWNLEFSLGINYGPPVTMEEGLFSESVAYAKYLSLMANHREILVPGIFTKTGFFDKLCTDCKKVKVITERDQHFVQNFFRQVEKHFSDEGFSLSILCSEIGVSRAQLYRKVMKVTGRSPGIFIRCLKMHRALSLIREENLNISEIALEVGYNNPSYFSKCFQERFGIMPSKVIS